MGDKRGVLSGHMKKAIDRLENLSGTVNLVIEVVDARAPAATRCAVVRRVLPGCRSVTVLSKADLADPAATSQWIEYLECLGEKALVFPYGKGKHAKKFVGRIVDYSGGGNRGQPVKAVVAGLPNVGKSTVLNMITGKKRAKVGAVPGVTRGLQLVNVRDGFLVLDTPGVVSSSAAKGEAGELPRLLGCIQESMFDTSEAAHILLSYCLPEYAGLLKRFYDLEAEPADAEDFFEAVARRRGFLLKGGMLDVDRVYPLLLRDFATGRVKGITLERPGEKE